MKPTLLLPLVALFLSVNSAPATVYTWSNPSGGSWSVSGNWTPTAPPGGPGAGDSAIFPDPTGSPPSVGIDLANGAGILVGSVTFNNAATTYNIYNSNNDQSPSSYEILSLNSLTMSGSGSVYLAATRCSALSLTVNSGYFAYIGTNVLSATNVVINGGTLCALGYFPSSLTAGGWSVNTGGTLKVDGTIYGPVVVGSATLAAGCSPGTADVQGDVSYTASGHSEFELATPNVVGGGSDLISVTGNLTLNGTLDLTALSGFGAGTYRLFNYTGSLTNNGVQVGAVPGGYAAQLNFGTNHQVNLDVSSTATQSYSVVLSSGLSIIANQLDHGSNTLDEVIADAPDGAVLMKWDCAAQAFTSPFSSRG